MRAIPTILSVLGLASLPACMPAAGKPDGSRQGKDEVVLAKPDASKNSRIKPRVYLSTDRLKAGSTQRFAVVIDIEPGWHINTNIPRPSYVIPTSVKLPEKQKIEIKKIAYPKGKTLAIPGAEEPLNVYEGRVIFFGDLTVPKEFAGKTEAIKFLLKYQLCNDRQCLAPKTVALKGKVAITDMAGSLNVVNSKIFKKDPRRKKSDS